MVGFRPVAQIDDHRVVEHRAVALRHGFEFLEEAGDQVHVVSADDARETIASALSFRAGIPGDLGNLARATNGLDRNLATRFPNSCKFGYPYHFLRRCVKMS